jgi:methylenetetrahydrofolate dehydrogenase (NADP+)/methenyltetrahydrofolate cyclohydrolase
VSEATLVYGKPVADKVLKEAALEVQEIREARGISPLLVTIEVGDDAASKYYIGNSRRIAAEVGIDFEFMQLAESVSQSRLLRALDLVNRDPAIHGIMLHMPLPAHLDHRTAQWGISSEKDVEGVTPCNLGRMFIGDQGLLPCTAQAIVAMIKSTEVELRGKEVTIVGSSTIVGKPCSVLLLNEGCTVTTCQESTSERGLLENHVRNAEILVVAVGIPNLIKGEWIKEGAIVIDAGIISVNDQLIGDVEFETASRRASFITPVPGGVGKVTVAYLMRNTLEALRLQGVQ